MHRFVTAAALATLVTASVIFLGPNAAHADTKCQVTDSQTGQCLIWVTTDPPPVDAGNGGTEPADTGSGAACYWDPSKQGLDGPPAGPVPCTDATGYWSNHYNCYISTARPQPPATDPSWQGHQPGDGSVYQCYQPQTDLQVFIWSANPPPGSGIGPTPREVAQLAITQMDLRAIDIGITPDPAAGRVGIVGMPVWMWVRNPNGHTFGPSTASAAAGGITVTATARVAKITWVMGDDTEVVCRTAGTPYEARFGKKESPDCGHTYEQASARKPHSRFTVTAVSDWVINWAGAGQTGTIRLNGLQRSVQIAVGEAQVLVN